MKKFIVNIDTESTKSKRPSMTHLWSNSPHFSLDLFLYEYSCVYKNRRTSCMPKQKGKNLKLAVHPDTLITIYNINMNELRQNGFKGKRTIKVEESKMLSRKLFAQIIGALVCTGNENLANEMVQASPNKIKRKMVEHIEEAVARELGKKKLSEEDLKTYNAIINSKGGLSWTDRGRLDEIINKMKKKGGLYKSSLWKHTKGDYDKVINWVKKKGANIVLKKIKAKKEQILASSITAGAKPFDAMWEKVKKITRKSGIPSAQLTSSAIRGYHIASQNGYVLRRNSWDREKEIEIKFVSTSFIPTENDKTTFKKWSKILSKLLKENKIKHTINKNTGNILIEYITNKEGEFKKYITSEVVIARKNSFQVLKENKVPLTPEERAIVMKEATWNNGPDGSPSPAVWKSYNKKTGKTSYVTNTHRAYRDSPTLKGAIKEFEFIKTTAKRKISEKELESFRTLVRNVGFKGLSKELTFDNFEKVAQILLKDLQHRIDYIDIKTGKIRGKNRKVELLYNKLKEFLRVYS